MKPDPRALTATTADMRVTRHRDSNLAIPGYQVFEILGEGGMGTVYAGEQASPKRRVAIKVLHARSGNALMRFQTEAQVMARLDHPAIARVLEAGETDGCPFLVMEHVDGVTLDREAAKRTLTERLELFASICDAVQHAHMKGVIHRDLKPSNVMVRADGRPVVLDFGVARLAIDDGKTPGATHAGELIGTPLYMSPEQALLRADEVDARSDIYTLGVILYELASGELPYDARDLPLPALTCVICDDPPIPLGKRDATLRGDLEAITMKALAKDPGDRYPSAVALADDVRRFVAKLPVSVRTPSRAERLQRFVRRRPLVALAIGGSVVALAAFATVVTALWLDARAARQTADAARAHAEAASAELEARTNQLTLRQARVALSRDPTESLAWLETLTTRGVDAGTAWAVAEEAFARGVAADELHGDTDEVHWVEPMPAAPGAGGAATARDAFVTASYDGRAILWTGAPATAHPLFTAKHGRLHAARPSPDGQQIAIGGDFGALHVVAPDGRVLAELPGHVGDVQHYGWSPDGAWLATGDDHGGLWLWPHGAAPGKKLASAPLSMETVAFSADSRELVAGDRSGDLWLWDLAAGTQLATKIDAEVLEVWTDGARVIAVDADGAVRTWHVDADHAAFVLDRTVTTGRKCKRAVFAPGGAWVVLGGVGGTVDRVIGDTVEPLTAYHTLVRSLAITPNGQSIAAASDDGALEVIQVAPGPAPGRRISLRGHSARVRHLAFADGGRTLLSADADGVVRRWDIGAIPPTVLDAHGAVVERMAAAAEGGALAAVDARGDVTLWTLADGGHTHVGHVDVPIHETRAGDLAALAAPAIDSTPPKPAATDPAGRVTQIAIATGGIVVTGTAEGDVTWWTPTPVHRAVHGIVKAIATTGDRVAVATSSGEIAMFTATGEPRPPIAGNTGGTEAIAFDPHGTLLASGGQDRVIRVWKVDAPAGDPGVALDNPHGDTHFVAFSPAGDALAIAANDGSLIVWTVRAGIVDPASAHVVAHHVGAITALAFDPSGRWLAATGRDSRITRVPIRDGIAGPAESTALSAAGIALAFDPSGDVFAVTRAGTVERWSLGQPAVVVIDHGIRDGVVVPGQPLWGLAFDDGTIVLSSLQHRPLAELAGALARATTFTLAISTHP